MKSISLVVLALVVGIFAGVVIGMNLSRYELHIIPARLSDGSQYPRHAQKIVFDRLTGECEVWKPASPAPE